MRRETMDDRRRSPAGSALMRPRLNSTSPGRLSHDYDYFVTSRLPMQGNRAFDESTDRPVADQSSRLTQTFVPSFRSAGSCPRTLESITTVRGGVWIPG